jgi:phenylacetate-CoA ligase
MLAYIENILRNKAVLQKVYYVLPDSLKTLALNLRAYPLARLRYSSDTLKLVDDLISRDSWSYNQLQDYINEQMEILYGISREVPFYNEIARGATTIREFPLVKRKDVKENYHKMLRGDKRGLIKVFTSGTSGSGLPVFYDRSSYIKHWAYSLKQKVWAGVAPTEWRIIFYGPRVCSLHQKKPPFWMTNVFEHQHMMSIFHLSEKNAKYYVDFLERHQGMVVEGFATVLYLVAQYISAFKGRLSFKAVFSTGEPMYPFMRKAIEDAFGTKVYDSYGMTEMAGFIFECEKGGYHAMLDYGFVEIVDEKENPVPHGEEGYLVWTGFTNHTMPFIRYMIGDKGRFENKTCSCNRPFPLVNPTITRDSDYLITKDGTILSPRAINQVLKNKVSFKACQFIQNSENEIIIRVVPDRSRDFSRELMEVRKHLQDMAGEGVSISEEIAREPLRRGSQGKIPLIVSNIRRSQ